ncbi:MAG: cytochrome c oxidase subunit 3 [Deltaproteobacteria bacterium]|nr:cytochrome c oxidase subunit 3 [Deltaproteobacteria bacterium]
MHAISNNMNVRTSKPLLSNGVLGMILFVFTEVMFFAALISAYLIIRSNEAVWPPWGQPRLPVATTGFNTLVLFISGICLIMAYRSFSDPEKRKKTLLFYGASILLGGFFVLLQGYEWIGLIKFGLTLSSSLYGSLFYLIIGLHGIHAIGALIAMLVTYLRMSGDESRVSKAELSTVQFFWFFVVAIWPILYVLLYLV